MDGMGKNPDCSAVIPALNLTLATIKSAVNVRLIAYASEVIVFQLERKSVLNTHCLYS